MRVGVRNISRLNPDVRYNIDSPLEVPPIFRLLQVLGSIEEMEMYQTFNMGLGFAVLVSSSVEERALEILKGAGARRIGTVVPGKGIFIQDPGLEYDGYV